MIDPVYPALSHAIATSVLWRAGSAAVAGMARAWPTSLAARACTYLRQRVDGPASAWMAAIGITLCLLIQPLIPAYVRPGMPKMWPLATIAIALVAATGGRAISEAWPHSRLARLFAQRRQ